MADNVPIVTLTSLVFILTKYTDDLLESAVISNPKLLHSNSKLYETS